MAKQAKVVEVVEEKIRIPDVTVKHIMVTITRAPESPGLLHNRPTEKSIGNMEGKQTGEARGQKEPRDPETEWREHLHVIDEARQIYGFPVAGLKGCLVTGGMRFCQEKAPKLRGEITVASGTDSDLIPIRGSAPIKRRDFGIFPTTGVAALIYRPWFKEWEMDVHIFVAGTLQIPQLMNIVARSGRGIGIGAFRPDSKKGAGGTFGMFVIKGAVAVA